MLGQGFTEDLLGVATDLPLPEIEDALRQAVDHNILRATAGELRFRHDLMREAIYDDLLPAQRHRLHLAAAAAIEADETIIDPPGARWGVLALHWKSASNRMRALGASIEAARWASLVGAPSEAADHLETALALWEQTPPESHPGTTDRAALLGQGAEARFSAGQALRARTLAVAGVTELAGSADLERVALAQLQVGVYSRVAGEAVASAEAFERAVGLLADRPPSPAKAVVMARYAGFLMVGQRVRRGLVAVEAALDLARRTGSRRVEGHAMCTKGAARRRRPAAGGPAAPARLLRDRFRGRARRRSRPRGFRDLTYVQLFAGLADEALATADAGLQVVVAGHDLWSGIGIAEHQAEAVVQGRPRWGTPWLFLNPFPYDALEGSTLVSFAAPRFDVFLRRGELDAAARTLAPAIERAAAMDDAQFGANTRIRAAQLALATGHLDDARAHISAALATSDRCDDMIYAPKACSIGILGRGGLPGSRPRHRRGPPRPGCPASRPWPDRLEDDSWPNLPRSWRWPAPKPGSSLAGPNPRPGKPPQQRGTTAVTSTGPPCAGSRQRTPCFALRVTGALRPGSPPEALAAARSLGAAPLAADLEVLTPAPAGGSTNPGEAPAPARVD